MSKIRHTTLASLAITTILAAGATGSATQADSVTAPGVPAAGAILTRQTDASSGIRRFEQGVFRDNPASMYYYLPYSLSDFRLHGKWRREDEAVKIQEGDGKLLGNVDAHSYLRLNPSTTVWGSARFSTGTYHGIRWSNCTDIELVGPYILGDSVGGNLSTRQYSFSGGYAGSHRGWSWGAEASYSANISYRNRDPRDKIVVSDLNIRLGGTKVISRNYLFGIGGSLRVYNQECDLEFYNPNNDTRTYLLTGLGHVYSRFSGISDQSTAYKGMGYSGTLQLLPVSGQGFSFSATAGVLTLRQVLRNFNNLDLTHTDSYTLGVHTSYILAAGGVTTGVQLSADLQRRPGFENIFGTSVGSNYEKIGSRRNYLHDRVVCTLEIPVEFSPSSTTRLRLLPSVGGFYSREDYRNPNRALETHALIPGLRAGIIWRSAKALQWELTLGGRRHFATADRCKLPDLNTTTSSLGAMIVHDFAMLSANRTDGECSLSALWQFDPSMALKVATGGTLSHYHSHGTAREAFATVAMVF